MGDAHGCNNNTVVRPTLFVVAVRIAGEEEMEAPKHIFFFGVGGSESLLLQEQVCW